MTIFSTTDCTWTGSLNRQVGSTWDGLGTSLGCRWASEEQCSAYAYALDCGACVSSTDSIGRHIGFNYDWRTGKTTQLHPDLENIKSTRLMMAGEVASGPFIWCEPWRNPGKTCPPPPSPPPPSSPPPPMCTVMCELGICRDEIGVRTSCTCGSAETYCVDHCKEACAASHTSKASCEASVPASIADSDDRTRSYRLSLIHI